MVGTMWTRYKVSWTFYGKVCGSVPADPEIIAAWIKARAPKVRPAGAKSIEEIQEEVFGTIAAGEAEDKPEYSMLIFQRQAGMLVVRAGTVKAHIKDCARVLSTLYVGRIKGERAFSGRVINGLYLDPREYWLPLLRTDGTAVSKADGERDKAIHVRGPRGEQMNAIKRYEWVEGARLDFSVRILGKSVPEEDLRLIFEYGGTHGYGGERGDGEGKYDFTLQLIDDETEEEA